MSDQTPEHAPEDPSDPASSPTFPADPQAPAHQAPEADEAAGSTDATPVAAPDSPVLDPAAPAPSTPVDDAPAQPPRTQEQESADDTPSSGPGTSEADAAGREPATGIAPADDTTTSADAGGAPEIAAADPSSESTSDAAPSLTPTPAALPRRPAVPSPASVVPGPAPAGRSTASSEGAPTPTNPATPSVASRSAQFGRVAEDGTVYVRTPEGEKEVGSYPGAPVEEALAYFTRKYDEVFAVAELLYQRVTQTDLSARDATDNLAKLRESADGLHAVGDLVALAAKIETIATAVEARKTVEHQQRSAARQEALVRREAIVAEAEGIAAQPEAKIQWKSSSARMRALLDEWKAAQRGGPKLDRETEQALWHRLSHSRNSFDKLRRVHFAQLSSGQAEAKAAKAELIAQAEALSTSTDWGATAGAFKQLMDRWRHAGRAARADDDALWARFKAAQDAFFTAKDAVSAAENEEFKANLVVKEELLSQAQALLPVRDLERTKSALRGIQDKWDAAGKVPRSDLERVERNMRKVEQTVREAEDKKWKRTDPEVAARAASLASQAEAALEKYRRDLDKAEKSGNAAKIAKAREALEARQTWLEQAQRVTGAGD